MKWHKLSESVAFIRAILIIAFSIGTITHIVDIVRLGFLGYSDLRGVSFPLNLFWTSLVVVDPMVVLMLVYRKDVGVLAALVVLVVVVSVNFHFISTILNESVAEVPSFALQASALLFAVVAVPRILVEKAGSASIRRTAVRLFKTIPFPVLALGLLIHVRGLIMLASSTFSLWSLWVHLFMLSFDAGLMYLLSKKKRIGRLIGIVGFGAFGISQAVFAVGSYVSEMPFTLEMGAYLAICGLVIASLLTEPESAATATDVFMFRACNPDVE